MPGILLPTAWHAIRAVGAGNIVRRDETGRSFDKRRSFKWPPSSTLIARRKPPNNDPDAVEFDGVRQRRSTTSVSSCADAGSGSLSPCFVASMEVCSSVTCQRDDGVSSRPFTPGRVQRTCGQLSTPTTNGTSYVPDALL